MISSVSLVLVISQKTCICAESYMCVIKMWQLIGLQRLMRGEKDMRFPLAGEAEL